MTSYNAATTGSNKLSYKELQTALKTTKAEGLTTVKLNSKQSVLQEEFDRIYNATVKDEAPVPVTNSATASNELSYPFCSNTVKVENKPAATASNDKLFTTRVIPAMNSKYAPSWLCKPYTVYVIDGVDYLSHELEAQLQGQVCELPVPSLLEVAVGTAAAVNEMKLKANLPPRLQQPALKDRVSKARPVTAPIINVSKELPKAKLTYKAQEEYNPYFIDTAKAAKYSKSLGDVEKQAARNLEDAIRATKQGLKNVVSFAKGFRARQVERAMKVA